MPLRRPRHPERVADPSVTRFRGTMWTWPSEHRTPRSRRAAPLGGASPSSPRSSSPSSPAATRWWASPSSSCSSSRSRSSSPCSRGGSSAAASGPTSPTCSRTTCSSPGPRSRSSRSPRSRCSGSAPSTCRAAAGRGRGRARPSDRVPRRLLGPPPVAHGAVPLAVPRGAPQHRGHGLARSRPAAPARPGVHPGLRDPAALPARLLGRDLRRGHDRVHAARDVRPRQRAAALPRAAVGHQHPRVAPLAPRDRPRGARQELRPAGDRPTVRHRLPPEGPPPHRLRDRRPGPRGRHTCGTSRTRSPAPRRRGDADPALSRASRSRRGRPTADASGPSASTYAACTCFHRAPCDRSASVPSRWWPSSSRQSCQPAPSRAALPSSSKVSVNVSTVPPVVGRAASSMRIVSVPQVNSTSVGGSNASTAPSNARSSLPAGTKRSRAPAAKSGCMPSGNQCARCSASVTARQTFSTGWRSVRTNTSR